MTRRWLTHRPGDAPTIRFYEQSGYTIISRVRDYYRPGDDKLIFAKRFAR